MQNQHFEKRNGVLNWYGLFSLIRSDWWTFLGQFRNLRWKNEIRETEKLLIYCGSSLFVILRIWIVFETFNFSIVRWSTPTMPLVDSVLSGKNRAPRTQAISCWELKDTENGEMHHWCNHATRNSSQSFCDNPFRTDIYVSFWIAHGSSADMSIRIDMKNFGTTTTVLKLFALCQVQRSNPWRNQC